MKIIREVPVLAIVVIFFFPFLSLGATLNQLDDPRWIKKSPWVNPKGTYLRTCNDNPLNATRLDLNDYDISIGDWIIISTSGDFLHIPSATRATKSMSVVFSTSTRLLADEITRLNRVHGAVPIPEGGVAYATWPTWSKCKEDEDDEDEDPKNWPTDIPEDFLSGGSNLVKVPARYLFVSAGATRYFGDNIDPERDYRVKFTDETSWDQDSTICTTCWNDPDNWSEERVPIPEVGVTFKDTSQLDMITDINSTIKYLRVVDGEITFTGQANILQTTFCGENNDKASLLVDSATINFDEGFYSSCSAAIGSNSTGEVNISSGGTVKVSSLLLLPDGYGSGYINVMDPGSLLEALVIAVGSGHGYGELLLEEGEVVITLYMQIGNPLGRGYRRGAGRVVVGSGGRLTSHHQINIIYEGSLVLDGGIIVALDGIIIEDSGELTGNIQEIRSSTLRNQIGFNSSAGVVSSSVTNKSGYVRPGLSTGKLIIDGNYIQETEGTIEIEIGGYKQEENYDILEVTGNVALDGTLQLDFINGFAPKKGDVFEFLQIGGTATGSFSNVVLKGLKDGFEYDIKIEGGVSKLIALNDGVSSKFPWPMFLPAITGTEK